jgi:hypothetical protein
LGGIVPKKLMVALQNTPPEIREQLGRLMIEDAEAMLRGCDNFL